MRRYTANLDFSIVRGGLFYRLQELLRLVDQNDTHVAARGVVFALAAWVPLALLSAIVPMSLLRRVQPAIILKGE